MNMKREQLKELEMTEEQINAVMKLHGEAVKELKTKADTVDTSAARLAELEAQLTEANKTIEGFKELDVDGIKKAADEWKSKAETSEVEFKKELESVRKKAFAKEYAAGLNFSSKAAKNQFVKDLLDQDLKFDDGAMYGVDEFAKKYAEQDPEAFKSEEPTPAGQVDTGAKHESETKKSDPFEDGFDKK